MTATAPMPRPPLPRADAGLSRRRRVAGAALAVLGPAVLTLVLVPLRDDLALASHLLLFLLLVVAVALVGGIAAAVLAAVIATLLLNWFFTPPYGTLLVEDRDQVIALVVFVVVAVAVSAAVEVAGRLAAVAARSQAETRLVTDLAGAALEDSALPDLLDRLRATFGSAGAGRQELGADSRWYDVAVRGTTTSDDDHVVRAVPVPGQPRLRVRTVGPPVFAADSRVLDSFATAAAAALDRQRLAEQAATAEELASTDRMRTALLAAVGHDLRTPLAAIKASASSLRQPDVAWSAEERAGLTATIEESADQLTLLVANLLDMSRLQAGALTVARRSVDVADVLAAALRPCRRTSGRSRSCWRSPTTCPP